MTNHANDPTLPAGGDGARSNASRVLTAYGLPDGEPFVSIPRRVFKVLVQNNLGPAEQLVVITLLRAWSLGARRKGTMVRVSISEIESETGIDRSQVNRIVHKLSDAGLIGDFATPGRKRTFDLAPLLAHVRRAAVAPDPQLPRRGRSVAFDPQREAPSRQSCGAESTLLWHARDPKCRQEAEEGKDSKSAAAPSPVPSPGGSGSVTAARAPTPRRFTSAEIEEHRRYTLETAARWNEDERQRERSDDGKRASGDRDGEPHDHDALMAQAAARPSVPCDGAVQVEGGSR